MIEEQLTKVTQAVTKFAEAMRKFVATIAKALIPAMRAFRRAFGSCQKCGRFIRLQRRKFPRRCHCGDRLQWSRAWFEACLNSR